MGSSVPLSARSSTFWKTQVTAGSSPLVAMAASVSPQEVSVLCSPSCPGVSLLPGFLLRLLEVQGEPPDRASDSVPQSLEESVAQREERDPSAPFAEINGQKKSKCRPKSVLGHQPFPTSWSQSIKVTQSSICGESQESVLLTKAMKATPQSLSPGKR